MKVSVIISVYKDYSALELILEALSFQTEKDFSVIVSEDGRDQLIKTVVQKARDSYTYPVIHLDQVDSGFRKNIALNRAVAVAGEGCLIFIDGDCIPDKNFVGAHLKKLRKGKITSGRRIELGARYSEELRSDHRLLRNFTKGWKSWVKAIPLLRDGARGLETALISIPTKNSISIVGCNFGATFDDIKTVGGFDEDYLSPGLGEDSDIEVRLVRSGVKVVNVKFEAVLWHLNHPREYVVTNENMNKYNKLLQENWRIYPIKSALLDMLE